MSDITVVVQGPDQFSATVVVPPPITTTIATSGLQGPKGDKGDVGDVNPQMNVILQDAEDARDAAQASELAAASSASAAAGSASAASGSASAASGSASAASGSASAASSSASAALSSKDSAENAQLQAEGAATLALGYANTATAQALLASTSASNAGASEVAAAASASAASADAAAASADALAAAADAAATAADRVQTGLDAQATASDRVQTGLDAQATAADRVQTGLDAQATAADRVQTGLDAQDTAADRVQTGLDASATAADRVQTGLDAQATAADRVQTDISAASASTSASAANTSAGQSAGSAAQALAIYGNTTAVQAAVTNAQAAASLAQGFAASASSVVQQDLSGINAAALHRSPNAVTAMFIYDTSKDSDGGAWTEKCQHTSWYNEGMNGKWLGAQPSETNARNEGAVLGPELVTNGTFDTATTGWASIAASSLSSVDGRLRVTYGGVNPGARLSAWAGVVGKSYKVSFDIVTIGPGSTVISVNGLSPGALAMLSTNYSAAVGHHEVIFTCRGTGSNTLDFQGFGVTTYFEIDNISVREVISQTTQTGDYYQLTTDGKFYRLNATSGVTEVFRGNKRDFPRLAGIVAETIGGRGWLTVYDLTEPGRPMWMQIRGTDTPYTSLLPTAGQSRTLTGIAAINGTVAASVNGVGSVTLLNFASEVALDYSQFNNRRRYMGGFAQRTTTLGWFPAEGPNIPNGTVNAVAMTVLPDAPVDPVTGLKVPTIACLPGETLVRMADGTDKRIDAVRAGDMVKTLEGDHRVLNFFDQGVKDVIELEFDDGKRLVCTPDHKIRTTDGWVEAGDLTEDHEVVGL